MAEAFAFFPFRVLLVRDFAILVVVIMSLYRIKIAIAIFEI